MRQRVLALFLPLTAVLYVSQINPTLYRLASGPNYGTYFYDVTTGNNQADPAIPGYPATTGWDPVTGLGTPNAAALAPALAAG